MREKKYLEEGVDPGEDFGLGYEIAFVHDAELLFLHGQCLRVGEDNSGREDIYQRE